MKRCEDGHFYDADKHSSCPMCGVKGLNVGETIKNNGPVVDDEPEDKEIIEPVPAKTASTKEKDQSFVVEEVGATRVGSVDPASGIDPVVGWLVCIEGDDKGRDFPIKAENNFIGRDSQMEICLPGDDSISRSKAGVIIYDADDNQFYVGPGEGRGLVKVNSKLVTKATKLKSMDKIKIGQTKLIFVPLCGDKFKW